MIPIQFEYVDTDYSYGYPVKVNKFVVVMNTFRHHYSGGLMHHVRIEYISPLSNQPVATYSIVGESDIAFMLKTRVTEE